MEITIEEAQRRLVEAAKETDREERELLSALDQVLAEDIKADMAQPPFARSAMDGYAVIAGDTAGAGREHPVQLKVIDTIYAGDVSSGKVHTGQAVRIMTGGMIPEGADCVICQEDTDYGKENAAIYAEGRKYQNCCPKGEDFHKGDILAEAGMKVDAYVLAAAASGGIQCLPVRKRVRAAVITVGEELTELGYPLEKGRIYNSNLFYLSGRLMQLGCEIAGKNSVGDQKEQIEKAIQECAASADVVITTGGVSVGQKDFLPTVIENLGARVLFHGIDIKPGMPTMASLYREIPILSLSGNPYSAAAVFELLFQPLQKKMLNLRQPVLERRKAALTGDYPGNPGCRRMLRGYYDGKRVTVNRAWHNAQMRGGIGSNCLVDIPEGTGELAAGTQVEIILL